MNIKLQQKLDSERFLKIYYLNFLWKILWSETTGFLPVQIRYSIYAKGMKTPLKCLGIRGVTVAAGENLILDYLRLPKSLNPIVLRPDIQNKFGLKLFSILRPFYEAFLTSSCAVSTFVDKPWEACIFRTSGVTG